VANGLQVLREQGVQPHDWVLVHDAARCLIRPEWVQRLIDACADDEVGGLLALPVADTLKDEVAGRVAATVDRRGKWAAQTPQMFRLGLLAAALAHAGDAVTDEASAIGGVVHQHPVVVAGPAAAQFGQAAEHALRTAGAADARHPARVAGHGGLEAVVLRRQHHQRLRQARHGGQRRQRVGQHGPAGDVHVLLGHAGA